MEEWGKVVQTFLVSCYGNFFLEWIITHIEMIDEDHGTGLWFILRLMMWREYGVLWPQISYMMRSRPRGLRATLDTNLY